MGRFQRCSKCVIAITGICVSVFIVGVVLLIVGFINYMSESTPPPYMWSLSLCQLEDKNQWVGYPIGVGDKCPEDYVGEGAEQEFIVNKNVLGESIPYSVMVYITNKVNGSVWLNHYQGDTHVFGIFKTDLDTYPKTEFAYCGGKTMTIFRNGPLNEDDGDYITETCQDSNSGCVYEPARSLTSYDLKDGPGGEQILHMKEVKEGSYFRVSAVINIPSDATGSNKNDFVPEVYIEYRVAGRGPEQDMGLILLIIGGVLADLMPATLYFLLQKYYYKNDENSHNQEDIGIPLMELDDK
ncbi:hypothetical protein RB653_009790 [Dictyostelium firmibasis]|uniref:Uncharacterized protein n=1 Tax=Dictyostelium firmibasis TaxID=79012 RepID=A0AAN7YT75_9MYCE